MKLKCQCRDERRVESRECGEDFAGVGYVSRVREPDEKVGRTLNLGLI